MPITTTLLVFAAAQAATAPPAQLPSTSRTDLQRHNLSIAGWETIQTRVNFPPGAVAPRHKHPGEEIIYVLKGKLEYRLDGRPPITLGPGDVLFIPYGKPHAAANVGKETAEELATYVVEKGKALLVPVP